MSSEVSSSLVGLLGPTRSQVVDLLRAGPASVGALAQQLSLSEPGVRRHLVALERDGLVVSVVAGLRREGRGRPSTSYQLTDRARRLYPDRSAEFANELLGYLEERHGRPALLEFVRWRQDRQSERYAEALDEADGLEHRVDRLAELLSEDGFLAEANEVSTPDGATVLQLRQRHCAIADVAAAHPEICAHEAAMFQRLLGAKLSRRQTIAGGASQCVCTVATAPPPISTEPATTTGAAHGHQG